MSDFAINKECKHVDVTDPHNGEKEIYVQLVLALALGISAFVAFCVSRLKIEAQMSVD